MKLTGAIRAVELSLIDECPTNPREAFEGIEELAADIEQRGLVVPLLLRDKQNGRFEVVCGARRLRALKLNRAEFAQATIRDFSEREVAVTQIAEEAHRASLLPLERAKAIERLMSEFRFTRAKVARDIGKSEAWVTDQVGLLDLSPAAAGVVQKARLSTTHARYIAKEKNPEKQLEIARTAATRQLTVGETRVVLGQIQSASLYVRGQLAMRDNIATLLRADADSAATMGQHARAAILREAAAKVMGMKPAEKRPHKVSA